MNKNVRINTQVDKYKNKKIDKKHRMTHKKINSEYKVQNT